MIRKLCAILCGVALTWACAATGLFFASGGFGHVCRSKVKSAMVQVLQIEDVLRRYQIEHQRCPATWNVLLADGYVRASEIIDPWGKDIAYSCSDDPDADPKVASAGPDKVFGTADDVRY